MIGGRVRKNGGMANRKKNEWTVLITGGPVKRGEVAVILSSWEIALLRKLILDHDGQGQKVADLWGKTTMAELYFKEETRRGRRTKTKAKQTDILERMWRIDSPREE